MEWLDKGVYRYERQHPPLSRVAVALPLYWRGLRGHGLADPIQEGNAILYQDGEYDRNLALARLGNLPFFLIACLVLALWARRWFGPWTAFAAVTLFTLTPPILGHAAVATTDMACASMLLLALYAGVRWLERPGPWRAILWGGALALALLAKFSVIPFLVSCACLTALWAILCRPAWEIAKKGQRRRQVLQLGLACIVAFVVTWSGYRFALAPVTSGHGYRPPVERLGRLAPVADKLLDAKVPLGEFLGGVASVFRHNQVGHGSYLLGEFRQTGWWYFFPVVLAVKTPLAFLALVLASLGVAWGWLRGEHWQRGMPLLFAVAILGCCLPARINLGVRHILAIYPLLALAAGAGLVEILRRYPLRSWPGVAMAVLLAALTIESASAQPDNLAYFNLLAGHSPERILADSDLDWGQDLKRLSDRLADLGVKQLAIAYFGTADLEKSHLPPFRGLGGTDHTTGWIALSVRALAVDCARDGGYCWLKQYTPVARVGRSILLFHITGSAALVPNQTKHD
jgi:hypothetical protein